MRNGIPTSIFAHKNLRKHGTHNTENRDQSFFFFLHLQIKSLQPYNLQTVGASLKDRTTEKSGNRVSELDEIAELKFLMGQTLWARFTHLPLQALVCNHLYPEIERRIGFILGKLERCTYLRGVSITLTWLIAIAISFLEQGTAVFEQEKVGNTYNRPSCKIYSKLEPIYLYIENLR